MIDNIQINQVVTEKMKSFAFHGAVRSTKYYQECVWTRTAARAGRHVLGWKLHCSLMQHVLADFG